MKVFVTGATGVIGRRLIPLLRSAGHDVTGIARSPQTSSQLERYGAKAIAVDLFDRAGVARAVAGHEVVINLATHIPDSGMSMLLPWTWRENDRIRRDASALLVDASLAAGVERFVQESFAPVYPDRGDAWIDERTPISPVRYNRTVADAEASAERFSSGGSTGIVLRFGAFYGADAIQTREFIAWMRKGWAPLPGSAGAYISSVAHDDAATAVAASLSIPTGTYNVVDDEPVTHADFVASLANVVRIPVPTLPPPWMTPLFGWVGKLVARSLRISNRKLRDASGWTPRYPSVHEGWPQVVAELERKRSVSGSIVVDDQPRR
jgi:nucleoside-diphosphate-sugar epimerase